MWNIIVCGQQDSSHRCSTLFNGAPGATSALVLRVGEMHVVQVKAVFRNVWCLPTSLRFTSDGESLVTAPESRAPTASLCAAETDCA